MHKSWRYTTFRDTHCCSLTLDGLCTEHYQKSDESVHNTDKKLFAPFSKLQLTGHDFPRHSQLLSDISRTLHRTSSKKSDKSVEQTDKKFFAPFSKLQLAVHDFPRNSLLLSDIRRALHWNLSRSFKNMDTTDRMSFTPLRNNTWLWQCWFSRNSPFL